MASQSHPPPSSSSSDSQRPLLPSPFITKTYLLVDDSSLDPILSWNENGTAFVVWNPADFARDILPKHFKHNNFSSFVRQLNTYGFRKVMPDRWEFSNDCFRRGEKRLLCDIVRRKLAFNVPGGSAVNVAPLAAPMKPCSSNTLGEGQSGKVLKDCESMPSVVPAALLFIDQGDCGGNGSGSSSSRAHLMDENDRLKKKNTQLCKELSQMKSMCTNIYSMMSNYNPGSGLVPGLGIVPGPPMQVLGGVAVGCGSHNSSQAESMMMPLRLLASVVKAQAEVDKVVVENPSLDPSLFGYQLQGSKRPREEGSSSEERDEQDDLFQLQQPGLN